MNAKDKLISLCEQVLEKFSDKRYKQKYISELKEIDLQDSYQYFIDIYNSGDVYENEHNLLIPYLLGICEEFDVNKESAYVFGEMPDVDTDIIKPVREYLKNEWAQKRFGPEYVAHIGTYTTYKLSSALLDMCKVFGVDRNEALKITKQFGLKDEDGDDLTWDAAIDMYPLFKEFVEKYPEMAEAAKKLTGRNKTIGEHAGGLIVSNVPIREFVPLMGKDYELTTAWSEGQASQDLSAVGLIKCDMLVISYLSLLSKAVDRIKKRYGLKCICSRDNETDWSDLSYLNDSKALALANVGDLKMIFQFDSSGIRALAKMGGVTSFDDIVAYTSLYRPATLSVGAHETYCNRKKGKEKYKIHPLIKPFTEQTYGILVFQEQIMRILNIVGDIPLRDCELIRKAISKKKIEYFSKYKEMFMINGQKNLSMSKEEVSKLWDEVEAFSGYGFNKCLKGDSLITNANIGKQVTIESLYENKSEILKKGFFVYSVSKDKKIVKRRVKNVFFNGIKSVYELQTLNGYKISATENHRFMCIGGWKRLKELKIGDSIACYYKDVHNDSDVFWTVVTSINPDGESKTYDLEIEHDHNYIANNIIVHNSHSVGYSYLTARCLYLKAHYPLEYITESLNHIGHGKDRDLKLRDYIADAKKHGIKVYPIDLNKSKESFDIIDNAIYTGFSSIKGIGENVAAKIVANQPYKNIQDFLERFGTDASVLKPLIALKAFGDIPPKDLFLYTEYYKEFTDKEKGAKKRYEISLEKHKFKLKEKCGLIEFSGNLPEEAQKIYKNYLKTINNYKENHSQTIKPFSEYKPVGLVDPKVKEISENIEIAEKQFYGFCWKHPLDKSKDAQGFTFESYRLNDLKTGPVEGLILTVTKKPKSVSVTLQDINWESQFVTVWLNDYDKFKEHLQVGKIVRMRLNAPSGGYSNYTLFSVPKWQQKNTPDIEYKVIPLN
jgi:DNA polymerase III alpha subunit